MNCTSLTVNGGVGLKLVLETELGKIRVPTHERIGIVYQFGLLSDNRPGTNRRERRTPEIWAVNLVYLK